MTMDANHLDGNAVAGLLGEIAGADMTTAARRCPSCGERRAIGEHPAYSSAGIVLRCPACADVAAVIAVRDASFVVEWRGVLEIAR
jgi:hypothetical protein